MVSQKLSEQDVINQAETLSFPSSVIEYFQGYLGVPPFGYLEPFTTRVLDARKLKRVEGRPGASLPPLDLESLQLDLEERWGHTVTGRYISENDTLSAALYPKVFDEYMTSESEFGRKFSVNIRSQRSSH